jgi:hypothetical protein
MVGGLLKPYLTVGYAEVYVYMAVYYASSQVARLRGHTAFVTCTPLRHSSRWRCPIVLALANKRRDTKTIHSNKGHSPPIW